MCACHVSDDGGRQPTEEHLLLFGQFAQPHKNVPEPAASMHDLHLNLHPTQVAPHLDFGWWVSVRGAAAFVGPLVSSSEHLPASEILPSSIAAMRASSTIGGGRRAAGASGDDGDDEQKSSATVGR